MHTGFWWRNLRERDLSLDGDNIKMDLKEIGWRVDWIDWLGIRKSGGLWRIM